MSLFVALVLAQVAPAQPTGVVHAVSWPQRVVWQDGTRPRAAVLDQSLFAERGGSPASANRLEASGAVLQRESGLMRLWKVEYASQFLAEHSSVLPVYRDEQGRRLRVPVGEVVLVPDSQAAREEMIRAAGPGAFERSGLVHVPCTPERVFETTAALAQRRGVVWAQPNWWVLAIPK